MADVRGFCCLSKNVEDKESTLLSAKIDKQLAKDKEKLRRTVKILLLGSGESGKSTLMKQMRIINGKDFLPEEIIFFKMTIYENIVKGVRVLVDACHKLQIPFSRQQSSEHASFVFNNYDSTTKINEELFRRYKPSVAELWRDNAILEAFSLRKEFHLVGCYVSIFKNTNHNQCEF